jgi:GNAT superfamily N-acetyltransferase
VTEWIAGSLCAQQWGELFDRVLVPLRDSHDHIARLLSALGRPVRKGPAAAEEPIATDPGGIAVRPALPTEADELTALALRSKAHWGYDAAFLQKAAPELTVTPSVIERHAAFVAERGGRIGGFYVLGEEESIPVLSHLWVDPPAIGTGLGSRLWEHMLRQARQRAYRVVRIESDPNAEGFYAKMGARRVGVVESKSIAGRLLPLMEIEP